MTEVAVARAVVVVEVVYTVVEVLVLVVREV